MVSVDGCSNTSTATSNIIAGLEESNGEFTVSPNPATTFVRITGSGTEPVFYNMVGQAFKLPSIRLDKIFEVNTSGLSPGLYIIRSERATLKLIKQ